MNQINTVQTRNRNRSIQQTNLNNSVDFQPKQRRYNSKGKMASENSNIRDLSGTINVRTTTGNATLENSNPGPSTNSQNINIDPEVRELVLDETVSVQRALEERLKKMVQDEMSEIRKSMGTLTNMVKEMSVRTRSLDSVDSRQQIFPNTNVNPPTINTSDNRFNFPSFPRLTANNIPIGNSLNNVDPMGDSRATPGSHATSTNNSRNLEKIRIQVDKWGIVFNGNSNQMSVEDFIFRIEHLQAHYDISWEEILRDFHLLVAGAAKDWYWLLIRTHGLLKWPALRCELMSQYQVNYSNCEIMRDLVERKQQPNETLDQFFHAMCKLRSRLVQPIQELDMIKILKRNVKESVGRIVYPIVVSTVEQLRMECFEAERYFLKREIRNPIQPPRPIRSVNEVCFEVRDDTETELDEISALKMTQLKCWNCNLMGHGFRDCNATERALFCYRCGKPNVIAPRCPDCQRGNRMRDLAMSGEPRPSKNPATEMN